MPTSGSNSIPSSEGHTTNTGFIWYTKCEIFHRLNIQVHLALGLMEFAAQTILKKVALFFQKNMFAMQLLSQIRVVCSNEVNI